MCFASLFDRGLLFFLSNFILIVIFCMLLISAVMDSFPINSIGSYLMLAAFAPAPFCGCVVLFSVGFIVLRGQIRIEPIRSNINHTRPCLHTHTHTYRYIIKICRHTFISVTGHQLGTAGLHATCLLPQVVPPQRPT